MPHSGNLLDNTPCGGVALSTQELDLRNSEGLPVDLRGGFVSSTLCVCHTFQVDVTQQTNYYNTSKMQKDVFMSGNL